MSSINLGEITGQFHEGLGPTMRLKRLASSWQTGEVYTFDRLYDVVSPSSPQVLSLILSELVRRGILEEVVRVESPESHGGIGDFGSVEEVPDTIFDWRLNREIEVRPENVQVLFRVRHGK